MEKISLTKLIQQKAHLSLSSAKSKTDALLNSETFAIEVESFEEAEEL